MLSLNKTFKYNCVPLCLQESEKGYWHVPIASELESEGERTWLCIRRMENQDSASVNICKRLSPKRVN